VDFNRYKEEQPVHIGCPGHCTGPPIIIYKQIFAGIVDDLACLLDHADNEDILAKIGKLTTKSVAIYDSESERKYVVYPLIKILLNIKLTRNASTSTDFFLSNKQRNSKTNKLLQTTAFASMDRILLARDDYLYLLDKTVLVILEVNQ
jgi:hypothetical protein